MSTKDLLRRLENLECIINPPELNYGAIWDFLLGIYLSVPGPGLSEEEMISKFVQENGTKEEFIEQYRESMKLLRSGKAPGNETELR